MGKAQGLAKFSKVYKGLFAGFATEHVRKWPFVVWLSCIVGNVDARF